MKRPLLDNHHPEPGGLWRRVPIYRARPWGMASPWMAAWTGPLACFVRLCYTLSTGQKALCCSFNHGLTNGSHPTERDSCDPPAGVVIRFLIIRVETHERPG